MTIDRDPDFQLAAWFDERATSVPPADLLERSLRRLETVGQRPGILTVGVYARPWVGSGRAPLAAPLLIVLLTGLVAVFVAGGAQLVVPRHSVVLPAQTATSPLPSPSATRGPASWHATGAMQVSRDGWETATLLGNGQVLIAGGHDHPAADDPAATAAELYDPASGRWTATESMTAARLLGHTATLLPDGRVLVVGGSAYGQPGAGPAAQSSAELFDPTSATWSATGPMLEARTGHLALRLADGSVLVVGGYGRDLLPIRSAEVYDPATGRWALASDPTVVAVADATNGGCGLRNLTDLGDGRFLILCGSVGDENSPLAELFDARTGALSPAGAPLRRFVRAAPLSDGRVLVTDTGPGELFDPADGSWTPAALPVYAGTGPAAFRVTVSSNGRYYESDTVTSLADGTVLITIGPDAYVYDPGLGR